MKRTTSLLTSSASTAKGQDFISYFKNSLNHATDKLTKFVSDCTGEEMNKKEMLHGTHAIVALIVSVFPVNMPLLIRILLLTWLGLTIYQCRHIKD